MQYWFYLISDSALTLIPLFLCIFSIIMITKIWRRNPYNLEDTSRNFFMGLFSVNGIINFVYVLMSISWFAGVMEKGEYDPEDFMWTLWETGTTSTLYIVSFIYFHLAKKEKIPLDDILSR